MKNKIKFFVVLLYFTTVLLFILIDSTIIEVIPFCEFIYNRKIIDYSFLIIIVILPIIGYLISLLLKIDKSNRFFFYLLIPLISLAITTGIPYYKKKRIILSSICKARKAKVTLTVSGKNSQSVDVEFSEGKIKYKRFRVRFLEKVLASDLTIGDSVLVIYKEDCMPMMYVYKAFPSAEESKKCVGYGYYYKGTLYSKDEFEQKFNKGK